MSETSRSNMTSLTGPGPETVGNESSSRVERKTKRADQTVDLVIYKSGERIVIGKAVVKGDGSIEAQIAKDVRKEISDLLFGGLLGGLSLDPKPKPDLKYNLISSTKAQEP